MSALTRLINRLDKFKAALKQDDPEAMEKRRHEVVIQANEVINEAYLREDMRRKELGLPPTGYFEVNR